jgi:hypothetical protein
VRLGRWEVGADALSYPMTTRLIPNTLGPLDSQFSLASAAHRRRLTDYDVAEPMCPTDVDTSTRPASTARLLSEAADGQSVDRSGSLQLSLLSFKAGPAGGRLRRPSSRRQRHEDHRGSGLTLSTGRAEAVGRCRRSRSGGPKDQELTRRRWAWSCFPIALSAHPCQ